MGVHLETLGLRVYVGFRDHVEELPYMYTALRAPTCTPSLYFQASLWRLQITAELQRRRQPCGHVQVSACVLQLEDIRYLLGLNLFFGFRASSSKMAYGTESCTGLTCVR